MANLMTAEFGMRIAELANLPAADGDFLLKLIVAVSVLINFFLLVQKFTGKAEVRRIEPQPLEVVGKAEFVLRPDFHKHAELNRQAHDRIEIEMRDAVRRIEEMVRAQGKETAATLAEQSREIGEIKALRSENGDRLDVIAAQLTQVSGDMREMGGVLHSINRRTTKS